MSQPSRQQNGLPKEAKPEKVWWFEIHPEKGSGPTIRRVPKAENLFQAAQKDVNEAHHQRDLDKKEGHDAAVDQ